MINYYRAEKIDPSESIHCFIDAEQLERLYREFKKTEQNTEYRRQKEEENA